MILLPRDLTLRLEKIFSKEQMAEIDAAFTQSSRRVTFRVNTLKSDSTCIESDLLRHNILFERIDFLENAYILGENFKENDLWKTESYKNGFLYIQGISSQIPVHFFSFHFKEEKKLQLKILDACAAPGGKTSQLAEKFPEAEIWAFEPNKIRYEKMLYNFEKLGIQLYNPHLNSLLSYERRDASIICIHDSAENIGKHISTLEYFDMILIDAPCSGEGGILYNKTNFLENWSLSHIKKNYARQKVICSNILPYLKVGGELIYSTCTIAPEENEAVTHFLLSQNFGLISEKIDIKENIFIKPMQALKQFGKLIFRKEVSENTIRVIPSKFSEGFYISKFRKNAK